MLRMLTLALLMLLNVVHLPAQVRTKGFSMPNALQQHESRPTVILVGTDWCKFCQAMKNTMLKNKEVRQLLDDNFRTLFLNAAEPGDIMFAGRTFKNKHGVHEMASELATINGQIVYPTLCIVNSSHEIIFQHAGYLPPKVLLQVLNEGKRDN